MNGATTALAVGESTMSDSFRVAHLVSVCARSVLRNRRDQYSNRAPSDVWKASVLATLLR